MQASNFGSTFDQLFLGAKVKNVKKGGGGGVLP